MSNTVKVQLGGCATALVGVLASTGRRTGWLPRAHLVPARCCIGSDRVGSCIEMVCIAKCVCSAAVESRSGLDRCESIVWMPAHVASGVALGGEALKLEINLRKLMAASGVGAGTRAVDMTRSQNIGGIDNRQGCGDRCVRHGGSAPADKWLGIVGPPCT
jgi:hypothetical protein